MQKREESIRPDSFRYDVRSLKCQLRISNFSYSFVG